MNTNEVFNIALPIEKGYNNIFLAASEMREAIPSYLQFRATNKNSDEQNKPLPCVNQHEGHVNVLCDKTCFTV